MTHAFVRRSSPPEKEAYFTPPQEVEKLLRVEKFENGILEPACGTGNITKVLSASGYTVQSSDLYDWGFGGPGIDFLTHDFGFRPNSLITNPPFDLGIPFLEKALSITNSKVAFLLRLQYVEGVTRWKIFNRYHVDIWVVGRVPFVLPDGNIRRMVPYAWYVFDLKNPDLRVQLHDLYK